VLVPDAFGTRRMDERKVHTVHDWPPLRTELISHVAEREAAQGIGSALPGMSQVVVTPGKISSANEAAGCGSKIIGQCRARMAGIAPVHNDKCHGMGNSNQHVVTGGRCVTRVFSKGKRREKYYCLF